MKAETKREKPELKLKQTMPQELFFRLLTPEFYLSRGVYVPNQG